MIDLSERIEHEIEPDTHDRRSQWPLRRLLEIIDTIYVPRYVSNDGMDYGRARHSC
jgi:hypothetical protein